MPPATVDAILLLGWMPKEEAVAYLQTLCWFDPQLTTEQAEEIWTTHRNRVEALPDRAFPIPNQLPIPAEHRQLVNAFLNQFRGPEVLDVLNINPMELLVYQMYVVADRADHHAQQQDHWARKSLVINRPTQPLQWRVEDGILKFSLPHAEHQISINPNGAFGIQQGGGFVSVGDIEGRMYLKAGYHRSYAFTRAVMNEPEASAKSMLVALTRALPPPLMRDFPNQGLRTTVLGPRAPRFADFFDRDLAMTVKLRKKKFEAHSRRESDGTDATPFDSCLVQDGAASGTPKHSF